MSTVVYTQEHIHAYSCIYTDAYPYTYAHNGVDTHDAPYSIVSSMNVYIMSLIRSNNAHTFRRVDTGLARRTLRRYTRARGVQYNTML